MIYQKPGWTLQESHLKIVFNSASQDRALLNREAKVNIIEIIDYPPIEWHRFCYRKKCHEHKSCCLSKTKGCYEYHDTSQSAKDRQKDIVDTNNMVKNVQSILIEHLFKDRGDGFVSQLKYIVLFLMGVWFYFSLYLLMFYKHKKFSIHEIDEEIRWMTKS